MKYAVAHLSFFENKNQIAVVEADNPIAAMIEGARILVNPGGNPDTNEWLDGFLKDISDTADYAARVEEIIIEFFNADQIISPPVLV